MLLQNKKTFDWTPMVHNRKSFHMAPLVGLEPTTCGLTVRRSTDWAKEEYLCSRYLLSQAVARQVSSAQMCLTSVFGMGTGGPTSQSIPTHMGWAFDPSFIVKSLSASNSKEIIAPSNSAVKNFLANFWGKCTLKTEHCFIFCNPKVWSTLSLL